MPALPQTIEDRLRRIEESVRQVIGRANIRPALDLVIDGLVRIGSGGALRVDHADSTYALYTGDIAYPYTDGSPQRGTVLFHANGALAAGVYAYGAASPGSVEPDVQRVHIRDPDGAAVLLTHPSGGLDRPWLAMGWQRVRNTEWASTASATFEGLYGTRVPRQHPSIVARVGLSGIGGGTAEARLVLGGSPVGNVLSTTGTTVGTITADVSGHPLHTEMVLTLEVRRTNAVGSAAGVVFGCWGTG